MFKTRPWASIKIPKGRCSLIEARFQLQLNKINQRQKKSHRKSLLMRIVSDKDKNQTVSSAYDEIVNSRNKTTMVNRAAERGNLYLCFIRWLAQRLLIKKFGRFPTSIHRSNIIKQIRIKSLTTALKPMLHSPFQPGPSHGKQGVSILFEVKIEVIVEIINIW